MLHGCVDADTLYCTCQPECSCSPGGVKLLALLAGLEAPTTPPAVRACMLQEREGGEAAGAAGGTGGNGDSATCHSLHAAGEIGGRGCQAAGTVGGTDTDCDTPLTAATRASRRRGEERRGGVEDAATERWKYSAASATCGDRHCRWTSERCDVSVHMGLSLGACYREMGLLPQHVAVAGGVAPAC